MSGFSHTASCSLGSQAADLHTVRNYLVSIVATQPKKGGHRVKVVVLQLLHVSDTWRLIKAVFWALAPFSDSAGRPKN
jgi:hypothetical protein